MMIFLAKPCVALGIGKNEMAKRVGTQRSAIEAILLGGVDHELIEMMAQQLHLDAGKLIQSAGKIGPLLPLNLMA